MLSIGTLLSLPAVARVARPCQSSGCCEPYADPRRSRALLPCRPRTRRPGMAGISVLNRSYGLLISVFFRVLRTVTAQIEGTTSNTTSTSASNCNDHRPYLAGGGPSRVDRDQLISPHAIQLARRRRRRTFPAFQRGIKARCHQSLTKILHRPHSSNTYASVVVAFRPPRPIRIRLEQDLRPLHLLRRSLEPLDDILADSACLIRQPDDILCFMRTLSLCLERLSLNSASTGCQRTRKI